MVKSVYSAVKKVDSTIEFGISPQSKISANYNNLYADVERWATEDGYIDYICPSDLFWIFYNGSSAVYKNS